MESTIADRIVFHCLIVLYVSFVYLVVVVSTFFAFICLWIVCLFPVSLFILQLNLINVNNVFFFVDSVTIDRHTIAKTRIYLIALTNIYTIEIFKQIIYNSHLSFTVQNNKHWCIAFVHLEISLNNFLQW